MKIKKLLIMGPMLQKKNKKNVGGVVILFDDLVLQCKNKNIPFSVIDTNRANYKNKVVAYFQIMKLFFLNMNKFSHISLHGTSRDYLLIAPIVVFFGKMFNKHISLRKFAGNYDEIYDKYNFFQKKLIEYTLTNANVLFFETKYLVEKFKKINHNTYWFPNVRTKQNKVKRSKYQKKFIFIGQLKKEKGVMEILQVSNLLSKDYVIHLYGPIMENMKNIDFKKYNAVYKGIAEPQEIRDILLNYDVLLLPTYWKNEGYPGVIIEALSVGLPVIATDTRGIKEIVNNKSAILIKPKNIEMLKNAIISFNEYNYKDKSHNAINQFKMFDSDLQTSNFLINIGLLNNVKK